MLLLGDRWPLKPAVIATYWSGICDQYCLYRENFKYKLHRISVCEGKSPVWWDPPPFSHGAFSSLKVMMAAERGQWPQPSLASGTEQSHFFPGRKSLPKIRLPSSIPLCFLNRFDCKTIFTGRPKRGVDLSSCAWTRAAPSRQDWATGN